MNKLSKRAITVLILTVMILSMMPLMPVKADIGNVVVYEDDGVTGTDHGEYDETIVVKGDGVTAGEDVKLGWDGLKAWDGEKGILNTTEADGDGSFEIWFDVPEATNGTHYIWLKDTDTGDTWGGVTDPVSAFNVHSRIKFDPSSGLIDDKITVKGYGFAEEEEIKELVFIIVAYADINVTLSPSHPETDDLGSWEATFRVPTLGHDKYDVEVWSRNDDTRGLKSFTVGPSITLDVDEGPVGTVVEISGRGFTDLQVIDTGSVTIIHEDWANGVLCFVTNDDTVENGKFKIEIVVPSVDKEDDDYDIVVDDGAGRDADEGFEVTGLAEIEAEPEFGSQGSTISIKGYNFTQESGEEVSLELYDEDGLVYITDIDEYDTDGQGEFEGTFTIPARSSGVYTLMAKQEGHGTTDDYNINGTTSFRIGLMIVIPTPNHGPSGALITLTGTGFTENEDWNATLGDETLVDDGDVDGDSNLELNGEVPTFFVPTMDPGTYTLTVLDIDSEIEVEADFTVTATTMAETDPLVAPNEYNVSITGRYFSEEEGTDIEFVLFNVTDEGELEDDWDMDVYWTKGKLSVETDEDGNFTAWWEVPEDDVLSLGEYWINVTDDNDIYDQIEFNIVAEASDIEPRKSSFAIGETVAFDIESSFAQDLSYIEIYDPDGEMYWRTRAFDSTGDDDVWIKVGVIQMVPYYEQTAGGNPMVLEDVPLGTWSWTWFDDDDDELDSGTFTVTSAPADILAEQLAELTGDMESLTTDFSGLTEDVAALSGAVSTLADSVSSAVSAANAARAAADDANEAISEIATTANSAKDAADAAKSAADAAKDSADAAGEAASGLTTLVYGAIGASLIAALAAIVSLMQISRRIAG
jgi:hypothetical protein